MKYHFVLVFFIFTNYCYSQVNYLNNIDKSAAGVIGAFAYGPGKDIQKGFVVFTGNKLIQFGLSFSEMEFSNHGNSYTGTYAQPSFQIHTDVSRSVPFGLSLSISYLMTNQVQLNIPKYHFFISPNINYKVRFNINNIISCALVPEIGLNQMVVISGSNHSKTTTSARLSYLLTLKSKYSVIITGENSQNDGRTANSIYFGVLID